MSSEDKETASLADVGLRLKCPRCGKGQIYSGLLDIAEYCTICNLSLKENDVGDGAAFFAMFAGCIFIVLFALITEALFTPPIWLHLLIWTPLTIGSAIVALRSIKAILLALQYRYRTDDL